MAKGAGRKVVKVSPYNTSQICSECDELREPRLKLGQKIFTCSNFQCKYKENRDINAAKNIRKRYLTERRGTSPWGAVSMEAVKNHKFSTEKPPLL
jgi:transposase